jgi:YHYH protein
LANTLQKIRSYFGLRTPLLALTLGAATGLVLATAAVIYERAYTAGTPLAECAASGFLSQKTIADLSPPYSSAADFDALEGTNIWKHVISQLIVNRDKKAPCFGISDTDLWTRLVSNIPADVLAVQTTASQTAAIIYVSGIPDYLMETPKVFASFKPGQTYGIFRVAAKPTTDDRPVHDLASKGAIGIFVNGVSIFNYTDTFSYNDKGVWSYNANVAEALIVNSDVAHCTPSILPGFPRSPGIFHNHQMSIELLEELKDPYFLGELAHSKVVGFAIDSNPIYGPLGYASKDKTSGLKALESSYVKRDWMTAEDRGSNHRSSIPDWAVLNWDNSNTSGMQLLNLFRKTKSDVLFSDGATDGPVNYSGTDDKLAGEIKLLSESVGLKRDAQGYVYWESTVALPSTGKAAKKNYLLKRLFAEKGG